MGTSRRGAAGPDGSIKGQLVADKCFTLSEISVADIKDSGGMFIASLGLLFVTDYLYMGRQT